MSSLQKISDLSMRSYDDLIAKGPTRKKRAGLFLFLACAYNEYMEKLSQKEIVSALQHGGIGVLPTDTLYGVVGSALSKKAVARIYKVRNRDPKKPFIILMHSFRDLALFGVVLTSKEKKLLNTVWPGKVSVLLPCARKRFIYLHRGTNMLAFRIPADVKLRELLKKTGPLVAPSANTEGALPARTIGDALRYFGERVDFYSDGGRRAGKPSTLVAFEDGIFAIKRSGVVRIKGKVI